MSGIEKVLRELHKQYFGTAIKHVVALAASGSFRQYFRITDDKQSVLGVYNTDLQENRAYLSFSKTFLKAGIMVPEIYSISKDEKAYLVQDIGKETLWDIAKKDMLAAGRLSQNTLKLYKKTFKGLLQIQTKTIDNLDLSFCYPRDSFDQQSMLWDLYYFKYMFLRVMRVPFDEQKLENDLQSLTSELDKVERRYFLFRDFQSRNVMIKDNTPYFIDFQGGRKGAIFYDLSSMVYDANVELKKEDREMLTEYYYSQWNAIEPMARKQFYHLFYQFSIIRLLQALGAFGLRGVVEKKPHFVACIPFALASLQEIFSTHIPKGLYPELESAIKHSNNSKYIFNIIKGEKTS